MKRNISAASGVQTHPDYEMFRRLGSPLNFLSRSGISGQFFQKRNLSLHFTDSQTAFANHSMSALIELVRKFQPQEIFKEKPELISDSFRGVVSLEEVWLLEEFYEAVTQVRELIDENTKSSYQKFQTRQRLKNGGEVFTEEEKAEGATIEKLKFVASKKMAATHTPLTRGSRYSGYASLSKDKFGILRLSHFSNLLGVFDESDLGVIVGEIEVGKDVDGIKTGDVVHRMGLYRDVPRYRRDNPGAFRERDEMVAKVDYVMALAAKKALITKDQDEALKYAFIFGALRGYNVRSVIGACWAQEMSLRWIFAQKGWPQFCKMPGIYLDIEASLVGSENPEQKLKELIEREVREYKISVGLVSDPSRSFYEFCRRAVGLSKAPDSLFDHQVEQNMDHFSRYLIDTKKYRAEDLHEMIRYEDKECGDVFNVAASAGDKDFFKLLTKEMKSDPSLKQKVILLELSWSRLSEEAAKYGNPEVELEIQNFKREVKSEFLSTRSTNFVKSLWRKGAQIAATEEVKVDGSGGGGGVEKITPIDSDGEDDVGLGGGIKVTDSSSLQPSSEKVRDNT